MKKTNSQIESKAEATTDPVAPLCGLGSNLAKQERKQERESALSSLSAVTEQTRPHLKASTPNLLAEKILTMLFLPSATLFVTYMY